ncbi:hypothetical protein HK104_009748 [Borealophlyctis nickersoniae]|nr:hypothetical protein HK104_009748 [Borealophlyctis nickersoniae]
MFLGTSVPLRFLLLLFFHISLTKTYPLSGHKPPATYPLSGNKPPAGFDLATYKHYGAKIYVDASAASLRDSDGLTLRPPSTKEFAETFAKDFNEMYGGNVAVKVVKSKPERGIYLTVLDRSARAGFTYESGNWTSEGYEVMVGKGLVEIRGAGARGVWWGTRTVLQRLLTNGKLEPGVFKDMPSYPTRGYMLDAGRKWYSPKFLKDLCTYASFFKFSEFHYHIMDNYPLNRGQNATWNKVYSQFSLLPKKNPSLLGLISRKDQTLTRKDYDDLEHHCAQRGITVIPEIEAPGHALAITKWKPELALPKKDLLNLTHPDTIPTVQAIWAEFLPWFHTKEVHIGADEYDPHLADVYIDFVNSMERFIATHSSNTKRIRVWGTNEPSTTKSISKSVIVQHWQYGESDPVALVKSGYDVINSEDWWGYVSLKNDHTPIFPAPYPQYFNVSRTLNFAGKKGWEWHPALVNPFNTSEEYQLPPGSVRNKGAIMASWNDNGPNASTQLEAYYAWRDAMPVVGDRMWHGLRRPNTTATSVLPHLHTLTSSAPGQDLNRHLVRDFSWRRTGTHPPTVTLGLPSRGMNYTLTVRYSAPFTITGDDNALRLTNEGALVFEADGVTYPLQSIAKTAGYDPGHPGRIWSNDTSSTHSRVTLPQNGTVVIRTDEIGGSRVWQSGKEKETFLGRFEVFVYGGRNTLTSWSQMAFVAPLGSVSAGVTGVDLKGGI